MEKKEEEEEEKTGARENAPFAETMAATYEFKLPSTGG